MDNSVNFTRSWADYEAGFGDVTGNHGNYWLGLDTLNSITSSGAWTFRAEIVSWGDEHLWAEYDIFRVSDSTDNYRLTIGDYNADSTAPDYMFHNNNQQFTTLDTDNDARSDVNCAAMTGYLATGGWWYWRCSFVYPTAFVGGAGDNGLGYMYWSYAYSTGFYNQALKSLTFSLQAKVR